MGRRFEIFAIVGLVAMLSVGLAVGMRAGADPPAERQGAAEQADRAAPQEKEPESPAEGEEPRAEKQAAAGEDADAMRAEKFSRVSPPDKKQFPDLRPLSPLYDVWVDPVNKQVVLRGGVCLREGALELLACIHQWMDDEYATSGKVRRGTKEYESVLTVNTTAALVHAGLLAVGADPGHPAQFAPEYRPASGDRINVTLYWEDADGQTHKARAQDWLRNAKTGQAMEHEWVFAGSVFQVNADTGQRRYLGEEGNLICVANFGDAVLDIPVPSTAANEALLFEAFTERIPPLGTSVTIVLKPEPQPAVKAAAKPDGETEKK